MHIHRIARLVLGLIAPLALVLITAAAATPAGELEAQFAEVGSHEVTVEEMVIDDEPYRLYRPADAAEPLPVVVWGNGSDAGPDLYSDLHAHLASWGIAVVDSYDENTGDGRSIDATVQAVLEADQTPGNPLHGLVDPDAIGLAGHSQGATGVINAHRNFDASADVKTVVSVALPALHWCDPEDRYDTAEVTAPLMILGGSLDPIISPYSSNKEALQKLPTSTPGLLAMTSVGHNEVQGDGGAYRGYLTAWLRAQLTGDTSAEQAVLGPDAEIDTNSGWHGVLRNGS